MRVTSMDTYSAQALANLYKNKSSEETESTDFLTSEYESNVEKRQQEIESRSVSEVSADMSGNSNGMKHRMSLASAEVLDAFKTSADAITESDVATLTSQDQSDALEALQEAAANAGINVSGLSETDITSLSEEEVSDLYESVTTELSDMKAKGPGGPGGPPPMGPPPTESDDEDDDELSTIEAILEAFKESSDDIVASVDDETSDEEDLLSSLQQWLEKRAQTQYQNTSQGYGTSNTLFDEMY